MSVLGPRARPPRTEPAHHGRSGPWGGTVAPRTDVALAATLCLVLAAGPAPAQKPPNGSLEYAVKAAFLYNFAKFVEWPDSPAAPPSTLTLCVLGTDPFGEALETAVLDKTVRSRTLSVRRLQGLEDLGPCPILFIASSEVGRLPQILERLRGAPVLTVGESDGFARAGGMIGFFLEENRVRFEVNLGAAEAAGLRISSRLLGVAKVVAARDPGER